MTPSARAAVGRVRAVGSQVRARTARADLMATAAAMTAYAVFGLVPLVAIGVRVAAGLVGPDEVSRVGSLAAGFVPGPLHLDTIVTTVVDGAARSSWWLLLAAVLPVSLYAEGTVRCLENFSRGPVTTSRSLRGRLLTAPVALVAVVAVVLVAVPLEPLLAGALGTGTGPRLLGVFITFCILWAGATALLCLIYRFFASTPVRPAALILAAAAAGSWLAGQSLGYVLTIRLVSGFATAYGGDTVTGAVAALAFLLYLNHVVVLLGYTLALTLHEDPDLLRGRSGRSGRAARSGRSARAVRARDAARVGMASESDLPDADHEEPV